jgi:hypothetical protein
MVVPISPHIGGEEIEFIEPQFWRILEVGTEYEMGAGGSAELPYPTFRSRGVPLLFS